MKCELIDCFNKATKACIVGSLIYGQKKIKLCKECYDNLMGKTKMSMGMKKNEK
jgi:hypothetical protein